MKIALSMRVTEAAGYQERRDSISHDWLRMLQSCSHGMSRSVCRMHVFIFTESTVCPMPRG